MSTSFLREFVTYRKINEFARNDENHRKIGEKSRGKRIENINLKQFQLQFCSLPSKFDKIKTAYTSSERSQYV